MDKEKNLVTLKGDVKQYEDYGCKDCQDYNNIHEGDRRRSEMSEEQTDTGEGHSMEEYLL